MFSGLLGAVRPTHNLTPDTSTSTDDAGSRKPAQTTPVPVNGVLVNPSSVLRANGEGDTVTPTTLPLPLPVPDNLAPLLKAVGNQLAAMEGRLNERIDRRFAELLEQVTVSIRAAVSGKDTNTNTTRTPPISVVRAGKRRAVDPESSVAAQAANPDDEEDELEDKNDHEDSEEDLKEGIVASASPSEPGLLGGDDDYNNDNDSDYRDSDDDFAIVGHKPARRSPPRVQSTPSRPQRGAALAAKDALAIPIKAHFRALLSPDRAKTFSSQQNSKKRKRSGVYNPGYSPEQTRKRDLSEALPDEWKTLAMSDGAQRGAGVWPPMDKDADTWKMQKQEISCDMCNGRIHWACAGFDKVQAHVESPWYCPDCLIHFKNDTRDKVIPAPPDRCIRPNCVKRRRQAVKVEDDDISAFVIQKIIGRRCIRRDEETKKRVFEYLVLWDGYALNHSSWEPPSNFNLDEYGGCALMSDFEDTARDLEVDLRKRVALLPEAHEVWDPVTGDLIWR